MDSWQWWQINERGNEPPSLQGSPLQLWMPLNFTEDFPSARDFLHLLSLWWVQSPLRVFLSQVRTKLGLGEVTCLTHQGESGSRSRNTFLPKFPPFFLSFHPLFLPSVLPSSLLPHITTEHFLQTSTVLGTGERQNWDRHGACLLEGLAGETDTCRKQPPRIRVLGGGRGRGQRSWWLGSSALGIRAGISGVDVPAEPEGWGATNQVRAARVWGTPPWGAQAYFRSGVLSLSTLGI